MDPDQIHLVTAHVTATVSSRLTSLLRLVGHHENHLIILTAMKPLEVAKFPRPLSARIPRRLEFRRYTFHPCHVFWCRCSYFVHTNLRKYNTVQRWSIHTPVCVVTVRKIVNVLT